VVLGEVFKHINILFCSQTLLYLPFSIVVGLLVNVILYSILHCVNIVLWCSETVLLHVCLLY